jgi:hypothetical protein
MDFAPITVGLAVQLFTMYSTGHRAGTCKEGPASRMRASIPQREFIVSLHEPMRDEFQLYKYDIYYNTPNLCSKGAWFDSLYGRWLLQLRFLVVPPVPPGIFQDSV